MLIVQLKLQITSRIPIAKRTRFLCCVYLLDAVLEMCQPGSLWIRLSLWYTPDAQTLQWVMLPGLRSDGLLFCQRNWRWTSFALQAHVPQSTLIAFFPVLKKAIKSCLCCPTPSLENLHYSFLYFMYQGQGSLYPAREFIYDWKPEEYGVLCVVVISKILPCDWEEIDGQRNI